MLAGAEITDAARAAARALMGARVRMKRRQATAWSQPVDS